MDKSAPHPHPLSGRLIEIPDTFYKADLELHDRFQTFSSELMKLSLAGIAATGVFITILTSDKTGPDIKHILCSVPFRASQVVSVFCFAFATGCAMAHRFLASDGMFHHVRALKFEIVEKDAKPECDPHELTKNIEEDEALRRAKLKKSEKLLLASSVLLVFGSLSLGISFVTLLYP